MLRMLLVAAITLVAIPASAQTLTGDREREGAPHRIQVEGTLAGWRTLSTWDPFDPDPSSGWQDQYAGSVGAYARIRLFDEGAGDEGVLMDPDRVDTIADLDLGARAFVRGDFRVGNLYVGAGAGIRGATWAVRGGAGIGLPIASAFDRESTEVVVQSLFAHATWDAWLVMPDVLPVVVRGEATYDLGPFFAGIEVGASLMPFIATRYDAGSSLLAGQLAAWAGGRIEDVVALGVRGQVVGLLAYDGPGGSGDRLEEGFAALVPFVRLELRRWSFEARGTIHLDDPLGVFGEGARNWSVRLLLGVAL